MLYNGEWYRLVTSGFVHFGIVHIGFNMLLLWQLGQLVERAMSTVQFMLLYLAALLGGSLGVLVVDGTTLKITAGASGAVFGLIGAAAVGLHRRGVNVFSTGIGTALMLNLFITFSIGGISIGGHLGGLVAGAICGFVMLPPKWNTYPKWVAWATPHRRHRGEHRRQRAGGEVVRLPAELIPGRPGRSPTGGRQTR